MTDLELLAHNFEAVGEHTGNLADAFYQRFFAKHPEVTELFSPSLAPQQQMLNETLTAVIDHLDDARWVKTNMEALGIRHQGYEVTAEMYDWWIEALLETLEDLSGTDWSERLARVWREQLEVICALARDAQLEPFA